MSLLWDEQERPLPLVQVISHSRQVTGVGKQLQLGFKQVSCPGVKAELSDEEEREAWMTQWSRGRRPSHPSRRGGK